MPDGANATDVVAVDAAVARSLGAVDYGVTRDGFVPKPFGRLLSEKLALARELFGPTLDLTSGSVLRKLLEISALEDARTWSSLAAWYDASFVSTATGDALSRLGEELGLPRPFESARGTVRLVLAGEIPDPHGPTLPIRRGARLLSPGGHHAYLDQTVELSAASPDREAPVVAFYPGPEHNLDPSVPEQQLDDWHRDDLVNLAELVAAEADAGAPLVTVEHTTPLTGGDDLWPDERYRRLLLAAPRSTWTVDAMRLAASLVPGVRQVQVRDPWGGLDLDQSIFGNFNFIERLFGSERDIASPYYFTVLVAPTRAAIWAGPDGLEVAVETAIEDLRPIGIYAKIEEAGQVFVGVSADLVVDGVPLPGGTTTIVNASPAAAQLKDRLLHRLRAYVDTLDFGEPVRSAEVVWALMSEPGVADTRQVRLLRYPPTADDGFTSSGGPPGPQALQCGDNLAVPANEIAVFVDDPSRLTIVPGS